MNGYTLGELNRRKDCAAPDMVSAPDGSLSSSNSNPFLMSPDDDVQQWIDNLLAAPLLEPALASLPTSFTPYALPFDAQPWCLDALLAFPPTLDPRILEAPLNTIALSSPSPSLDSRSGSSAAPSSPASSDPPLSFDLVSSLLPTSWPVPTAFSPSATTTPGPSSPTLFETLLADSEADNLGVDLTGLRAKLDPSYHAALHAAITAIAAATDEKPPKDALSLLLREVDGKDKKDRRWFCRFRDCKWADRGHNRSDRAIAHLLKDHFGTRFECKEPACGREFKWRHDLQAHVKRDHAPDGMAPARVLCQHCGNDFSKKSNLDRHLREGICPSFGGGPGKIKSKAPRTRKSRTTTFRANYNPGEYDDGEYRAPT